MDGGIIYRTTINIEGYMHSMHKLGKVIMGSGYGTTPQQAMLRVKFSFSVLSGVAASWMLNKIYQFFAECILINLEFLL